MILKLMLWLALLPVYATAEFLAYPFAPFIALLDEKTAQRWFSWFMTPDNPMTGDGGHEARWAGKSVYLKKVAWLMRNKAYGFCVSVIGAKSNGPVTVRGNPRVSNRPLLEGIVIRTTPEGYWQVYYIKKTLKGKCLRVSLGWKLWDSPGDPIWGQYAFAVNPVMGVA